MFHGHEFEWVWEEFDGIDFGDARLNDRFLATVMLLSQSPSASINNSCRTWAQVKGAYRMLSNDKVESGEIFGVHQDKTLERIEASEETILLVQDTSFLNYHTLNSVGLGHIGTSSTSKSHTQGLVMHSTLAVTPSGQPLGLLTQDIWARRKTPHKKSPRERKLLPVDQKESFKWLKALQHCHGLLAKRGKRVVTIADRECDVFEFLHEARILNCDFVIRAVRDRVVLKENGHESIWSELEAQPCAGVMNIKVPRRPGQKKRLATTEVRFGELLLRAPREKKYVRDFDPVPVYGIMVKEVGCPKNAEPLEWVLLTNMPIRSLAEALEKITWYKQRWQIEIFHKILKTSCRVEERALRTAEQLKKFITLSSVTAWRIFWMTHLARENPDQSCTVILQEHEWRILQAVVTRQTRKNQKPPTIYQAVRWIAQLGGFLARKGDKEPGVLTVARGWETVKNMTSTWHLTKEIQTCG